MKYGKTKRYRKNTRKSVRRKNTRMVAKKRYSMNTPSWFPFGKSRTCKLRYCEAITINPGIGVAGTYVFSANGLYDPNVSGTGHQPYGFDQLMALYNHYYTTGARIKVSVIGVDNFSYTIGVKLCDSQYLTSNTPDWLLEQPGFKRKIVSYSPAGLINSISQNFSCKKFFRLKNKAFILADDTLSGSASANPAEQAYFVIVLQPVVNGADLVNCTLQVEIDYIATFTGPKELVAS